MPRFKGISHAWLPRFTILLTIIALIACGASSPEAPAPVLSDPAQPPAEVVCYGNPAGPYHQRRGWSRSNWGGTHSGAHGRTPGRSARTRCRVKNIPLESSPGSG